MRILVVEDEPMLAETVAAGLREAAMAVDVAGDGADALERLAVHDYDVVALDRDLPVVHGDEVCRRLTGAGASCRILMLTAARSLDDTVAGFGLGADDYLAKPFRFPELVARVRAPGRRGPNGRPAVLVAAGVRLDPHRREVTRDGREIQLTRKEFAVLELLLAAQGRGRERGAPAGERVGRERRSVHQCRAGHDALAAAQAGRSVGDPYRGGRGLPAGRPR